MPAPVSFNISLAPLPATFSGTPAEWAEAVRARLIITPSEPWSSFQNGGSIPSSNVGPVLFEGVEWRVFSSSGAYTYHRQNGAGLVDATVTNAKLAAGTAGGVLIYGADGRPVVRAPATDGQVLTLESGIPQWRDSFAPTGKYFEAMVGSDQSLDTDGLYQVAFDTVRTSANVTFDAANKRVPVLEGQVWLFYAGLQLEDLGTIPAAPATGSIGALAVSNPPTEAEVEALRDKCELLLAAYNNSLEATLYFRVDGTQHSAHPLNVNFNSARTRQGMGFATIIPIAADGFVDVAIDVSETTPETPGLKIAANTASIFGGVRLI